MFLSRGIHGGYCGSLIVAVLASLVACTDAGQPEPTERSTNRVTGLATGRSGPLERFPEMLDVMPAVRVADAGAARQAEPSDEELVAAVTRAGGRVLIGFKPAAAKRVRETGVVPAITRAEALDARAAIQALGVEITMSYRYTSTVAATTPPQLAPTPRRLPVVDHIEPSFPGFVTQVTFPQDTSWGVKKIRAHLVWDGIGAQSTRGQMANVTVIDTGVDYDHAWSASGDWPASTYCYWTATTTITSCYDDLTNDGLWGHGAHVAGIVASRDNAYGFIGVANTPAELSSIRVCDNGGCPPDNVLAALNWALGSGLPRHVVNVSIGYCTNYTGSQQAVAQLQAAGVLVIPAAGNVVPGAPFEVVCSEVHPSYNHLPDWPRR